MRKRHSLRLALGAVLAWSGCAFATEPPLRIRLATDDDVIVHELAASLGHFAEAGIEIVRVKVDSFAKEDYLLQAPLIAGQIDACIHWFQHAVFGARHNLPVTAVMLFNDAPGMTVLVANRVRDEIRTAADFSGRRIARGAGYGTKAVLTDFLITRTGAPVANYTPVMIGSAGRLEAVLKGLREGAVDVMNFQEPVTSALLETGLAAPLLDFTTRESTGRALGAPFVAQSLLMAPRFVAENPAAVQRLVDAFVRTMRFINTHTPDEILARLPPAHFAGKDRAAEFRLLRDTLRTYAQRDYAIPRAGAQLVADMIRGARFDDSEEGAWRRDAENPAFEVAALYENKFVRAAMARHPERPRLAETAFVDALPPYAPTEKVSGRISLWGHGSFKRDFMGRLVARWIAEFNRTQPAVTFENRMYGTASAIAALATGAGNVALLGEEISPQSARMFARAKGYAPTGIQVATGSLDVNFFDYAHMVFVHRDNPLTSLTLAQLDAIFGAERRRGAPKDLRAWGDLGLAGEWTRQRIAPYGWKVDEDFALFFREAVLENSHRWNPAMREFVHATRADGTQHDHGQRILDALAADRFGIAISNVRYARPEVKALALAAGAGEPACEPTIANLIAQRYPLVRIIPAFIDRAPGQPVEPAVREFLRFVLSREGQQALIEETGYLPLGEPAIRSQLEKLR